MFSWDNLSSYKKCYKKQYTIHVCKPPKGTIVINKLEQADVVKYFRGKEYFTVDELEKLQTQNPPLFQTIKQLLGQGKLYMVTDNTPYVLAGTLGEMWCIDLGKLSQRYRWASDDSQINIQSIESKSNNTVLDWTAVKTVPDNSFAWACFVPKKEQGYIQTSWGAVLNINGVGVQHGLGDFVIAMDAGGRPNIADRYVVNGNIFATTYNNQGWTNCIDSKYTQNSITINQLHRLIPQGFNSENFDFLINKYCEVLGQLRATSNSQMPLQFKKIDNTIQIKASVIEDYKLKNVDSNEASVAEKLRRFNDFITEITFSKEVVSFKSYNIVDNSKHLIYAFDLPATIEGFNSFTQNLQIYAGLMGYVPNGIQNCFRFTQNPTKYEHDGIHAYTISSSGMNRKLRLQDYESDTNHRGYERTGAESQRLYRAIDGADKYFDKVQLANQITVFRGMPARDAVCFSGRGSLDNLSGGVITNTAYTSSTLNLHSTLLFAKTNSDPNHGVILAIDLPVGMHADYIHNIAGWKEQFEVLWDRKYDIQVGEELLSFKGGQSFIYHVFRARVIEHTPMSNIPAFIDTSHHQEIPGINYYDANGRVNFTYETIRGTLLESFDILKKRGVTGVQFQDKLQLDPLQRDYIVVHAGNGDDDTVVDLAFTFNTSTNMIDVMKFTSKARVKGEYGDVTVRNYWSDRNRNQGAIDQNFVWETYNANDKNFSAGSNNFSFEVKSSITVKVPMKYSQMGITNENLAECVAYSILEYVKYNKDVTLLPMQDVAQYFDSVFKNTIINEGYNLADSIAVNRVGKETDENDGYVPLKYRIDGDNDDSLVLMMRLSRDSNGKLQLEYRGASNNNRVQESDTLRWNIFNQSIMERECNKILYVFASKLNLNHTRKADQLIRYVASNRGFIVTRAYNMTGVKVERNIHEKGNVKDYRLWYPDRKSSLIVNIKAVGSNYECIITKADNISQTINFVIPYNLPIIGMYRIFVEQLSSLQ